MNRLVYISVPDFISNTMFPVLAAKQLRLFEDEGLHEVQLLTGFRAIQALREGAVDFYASTAEEPLAVFPDWNGAKLLAALAHGTPYLLVMRADLSARRNDLHALSGPGRIQQVGAPAIERDRQRRPVARTADGHLAELAPAGQATGDESFDAIGLE